MYADDTTLLATLSTVNQDILYNRSIHLNNELMNISYWLKVNKLSLNVSKTKYMIFHTKNKDIPDVQLYLDGDRLERVGSFDFLGITIDESLTWNDHINCFFQLKHYL